MDMSKQLTLDILDTKAASARGQLERDVMPPCPHCGEEPWHVVSYIGGDRHHQIKCPDCERRAERDYPHPGTVQGPMAYAYTGTFPWSNYDKTLDEWTRAVERHEAG